MNMPRSGNKFARLLTAGVYQISFRESMTIQAIQDELGYALNKKGAHRLNIGARGMCRPKYRISKPWPISL
jgi:hypothetical protein